ncbi:hypothetical protein HDV06_001123 [Boothiomyces sp. JEL0866]|nr:hypothetical protein HDV06_001123 [Boothiomyces sp. JEL0866]
MYNTRKINKKTKISPISGSDWDQITLLNLGIDIQEITKFKEFFEKDIPIKYSKKEIEKFLNIDFSLIKSDDDFKNLIKKTKKYKDINKLIRSMLLVYNQNDDEPIVDEMAKDFFNLLGFYDNETIYIHGPKNINMLMTNKKIFAKPDICIEKISNNILLLVQEDKSMFTGRDVNNDAEAQLVAEMLSAYNNNINIKLQLKEENALEPQTLYGITLLGTYPTFYKFTISKNILDHISNGDIVDEKIYTCYKYSIGKKDINFLFNEKSNIRKFVECLEVLKLIINEITPPSESDTDF